jgi:hypothetical protein
VAGDTVYGPDSPKLGLAGQALHAYRLALEHPRTGKEMEFYAPPAAVFPAALKKAGYNGSMRLGMCRTAKHWPDQKKVNANRTDFPFQPANGTKFRQQNS